jgi:hypothetical protein
VGVFLRASSEEIGLLDRPWILISEFGGLKVQKNRQHRVDRWNTCLHGGQSFVDHFGVS